MLAWYDRSRSAHAAPAFCRIRACWPASTTTKEGYDADAIYSLAWFAASCVAALLLSSCAAHFTGGGWLLSANGTDKANIGLTIKCQKVINDGDGCEQWHVSGTYRDQGTGDAFKFSGVIAADGLLNDGVNATLDYESTNPRHRGEGEVLIEVWDQGIDLGTLFSVPANHLDIEVISGPFAGYANAGQLQGGNFKSH